MRGIGEEEGANQLVNRPGGSVSCSTTIRATSLVAVARLVEALAEASELRQDDEDEDERKGYADERQQVAAMLTRELLQPRVRTRSPVVAEVAMAAP